MTNYLTWQAHSLQNLVSDIVELFYAADAVFDDIENESCCSAWCVTRVKNTNHFTSLVVFLMTLENNLCCSVHYAQHFIYMMDINSEGVIYGGWSQWRMNPDVLFII